MSEEIIEEMEELKKLATRSNRRNYPKANKSTKEKTSAKSYARSTGRKCLPEGSKQDL